MRLIESLATDAGLPARAVYAHSQTVLLDDVLSAVDTHTAAILIKKCLFGSIMKGRTVVLVTHHFAAVASGAGWIVRMDNGGIAIQGTPEELRRTGALAQIAEEEKHSDVEGAVPQIPEEKIEGKVDAKAPKKLVEAEAKATYAFPEQAVIYGWLTDTQWGCSVCRVQTVFQSSFILDRRTVCR